MTIDEICTAAWNGLVPEGLTIEEENFCLRMIRLYDAFKRGEINQENAMTEKGKLIYRCEKQKRLTDIRLRGSKHTAAMWGSIAKYTHAYRKDRTLENADKLLEGVEGKVFQWEQMMEDKA